MAPRTEISIKQEMPSHLHTDNPAALRAQRLHINKHRLDQAGFGIRNDSHGSAPEVGDTYHLARELEHIYDDVIQQEFAPTGAFNLFEQDNRVPPGAKQHTVTRSEYTGQPDIHRSTDEAQPDRGRVDIKRDQETFQNLFYTLDIPLDFFDELHSDFAQTRLRDELIEAAEVIMERFATRNVWEGLDKFGFYGIDNYPGVQKRVLPVPLLKSPTETERRNLKNQFIETEQVVDERSLTKASVNRVVTSPRVQNYLTRKDRSENYGGSLAADILERIGPDEIEKDPDLKNLGGQGADGMFYYNDARRSVAHVVPEPLTMLPIMQHDSFEWVIPVYMAHGGIVMKDPYASVLAYVDASQLR